MEDIKNIAIDLVGVIDSKKGEDIRLLDISSLSPIADFFAIASANNQNQLLAMQDAVDEFMAKLGKNARSIEGSKSSTWILMDYDDIIVQLFTKEDREFYDIDRIWRDATPVEI